jgi:multiple antibiotic resistance protein
MFDQARIDLAITTFVTFFVVIDAVAVAPIFASLTVGKGGKYARSMAIKSAVVAAVILYLFALFGPWLLQHMGISLNAFRAGGGVLLFLIAIEMVFEKRQERQKTRADAVLAEEAVGGHQLEDISVFPIGIPMIAGPGSIATAMLSMQSAGDDPVSIAIVVGAIGLNLVLCALIFLASGPLMKIMGENIAGAIARIFGVILSALAVQLIVDGLKGAFGL